MLCYYEIYLALLAVCYATIKIYYPRYWLECCYYEFTCCYEHSLKHDQRPGGLQEGSIKWYRRIQWHCLVQYLFVVYQYMIGLQVMWRLEKCSNKSWINWMINWIIKLDDGVIDDELVVAHHRTAIGMHPQRIWNPSRCFISDVVLDGAMFCYPKLTVLDRYFSVNMKLILIEI